MFKSPPKKGNKRLMKSLPLDPFEGPNLIPMPKIKYSSRRDVAGGGGFDVGSSGEEDGTVKARASFPFAGKNQTSNRYRRRTADDFLHFVDMILDYTNYEQMRQQDTRRRHSSSPSLGSTGSGNESLPQSSTSGFNDMEEIDDEYDSDPVKSKSAPTQQQQQRQRGGRTPQSKRMTLINKKEATRSRKSLNSSFRAGGTVPKSDVEDETGEEDNESKEEDEGEDWKQVTCFCGRPFAGRPMIECSHCLTWIHLKCAKITKQRIPETWFCHKCKTLKTDEAKKSNSGLKGKKVPQNNKKSDQSQVRIQAEKISGSRKRKSTSRRQKLESNPDSKFEPSTKNRRLVGELSKIEVDAMA